MKDILEEAGIEVTTANKKQVDRVIHQAMGVEYKDCPSTWEALKRQVLGNEQKRRELINKLRNVAV